ncbi:hypothetical protein [Saccharomonospora sp. CUA-673]|uniref:hypothetical protein n=1 Tax=Saccharomonospora sp. CUA-673 TaxID=1904969 RepID=UPI0011154609|nr:hypothetical protein [Saccharomonospora sp. CUA-673]
MLMPTLSVTAIGVLVAVAALLFGRSAPGRAFVLGVAGAGSVSGSAPLRVWSWMSLPVPVGGWRCSVTPRRPPSRREQRSPAAGSP